MVAISARRLRPHAFCLLPLYPLQQGTCSIASTRRSKKPKDCSDVMASLSLPPSGGRVSLLRVTNEKRGVLRLMMDNAARAVLFFFSAKHSRRLLFRGLCATTHRWWLFPSVSPVHRDTHILSIIYT